MGPDLGLKAIFAITISFYLVEVGDYILNIQDNKLKLSTFTGSAKRLH
jgi:hypothetical protein